MVKTPAHSNGLNGFVRSVLNSQSLSLFFPFWDVPARRKVVVVELHDSSMAYSNGINGESDEEFKDLFSRAFSSDYVVEDHVHRWLKAKGEKKVTV
jgi:hypothetical protein